MGETDNFESRADPPSIPSDLSAMLGGVLSNPNAMAMISSLIGNLRTNPPTTAAPQEVKKNEAENAVAALSPLGDGRGGIQKGGRRDSREQVLLCALKPYLSRSRCDLVDRLLGILTVIEFAGPLLGIDFKKRE